MGHSLRAIIILSRRDKNHSDQGSDGPPFSVATLGSRIGFINPERVESVPDVTFVEFNLVTSQQLPKLILKGNLAMMFFLPGDVVAHRLNLREADRENPIAILPGEVLQVRRSGFQPQ